MTDPDRLLQETLRRLEQATRFPPKQSGKQWICRCPAHDDRGPSLSVAAGQRGIVLRCFAGCDTEDIAAAIGLGMRDLFYGKPRPERPEVYADAIQELAARRGWTAAALRALGVEAQDGDVWFPMRNSRGDVVGRKRRRGSGEPYDVDGQPVKSLTEAGTRTGIICPWPLPTEGPCLVVEGEADAASALSADWQAVIGTPGAELGSIAARALQRLLAGRPVVLVPDPGEAGRRWLKRVGSLLANAQCRVRYVPSDDKHDLDDRLTRAEDPAGYLRGLVEQALPWRSHEGLPLPPVKAVASGEIPGTWPCTDAGNAEMLAALFGDDLRYDHAKARWLIWQGNWWTEDDSGEVVRRILSIVRQRKREAAEIADKDAAALAWAWAQRSESRGRIEAAERLARALAPIADNGKNWDFDPWLFGVQNGVLDLRTGTLLTGRPEQKLTMHVPVEFNPTAECPRWEQFLREVFEPHPEIIPYVQRCVGYTLTGTTKEQCFFMLYGSGANGKGKFLGALRAIFGPYAYDPGFNAFEDMRGLPVHSEQLAELAGRRLVTASETREGMKLNEQRLKALSHGDIVSAALKYQRRAEFLPQCKIWLSFNHKPHVGDDSWGFWRSVNLIPFEREFKGPTDDKDLGEKLAAEAQGILAWAVRGLIGWHEQGLDRPAVVHDATESYEVDSNPLTPWVEDRCDAGDAEAITSARTLYVDYLNWCEDEHVGPRQRLSRRAFGSALRGYFAPTRDRNERAYVGVRLVGAAYQAALT